MIITLDISPLCPCNLTVQDCVTALYTRAVPVKEEKGKGDEDELVE